MLPVAQRCSFDSLCWCCCFIFPRYCWTQRVPCLLVKLTLWLIGLWSGRPSTPETPNWTNILLQSHSSPFRTTCLQGSVLLGNIIGWLSWSNCLIFAAVDLRHQSYCNTLNACTVNMHVNFYPCNIGSVEIVQR